MSNKISRGDFVLRKRKCDQQDHFKCHPLSFGQVIKYVAETSETRPDAPLTDKGESWVEVLVSPFDSRMSPTKESGMIQWSPSEMIKIPRFLYCVLGLLWPLLRLVDRKPLDGRITDW